MGLVCFLLLHFIVLYVLYYVQVTCCWMYFNKEHFEFAEYLKKIALPIKQIQYGNHNIIITGGGGIAMQFPTES